MHTHEQASRQAVRRTSSVRAQRTPEEPEDDLLNLQRRFGNAAVTTLVQRAPRDRPASTDVADLAGGHRRHGRSSTGAPKKAVADIHARVIKYDIDQDQALITIASGPDQGVQVGMSGSLLLSDGTEYADFVIEKASGRVSSAHLPLGQATEDQVSANPQVVIKASKFVNKNVGKEF